jgi:hypothetical protein
MLASPSVKNGCCRGRLATAFDVSILGGIVIPSQNVPEPGTLSLMALALVLLGARRTAQRG